MNNDLLDEQIKKKNGEQWYQLPAKHWYTGGGFVILFAGYYYFFAGYIGLIEQKANRVQLTKFLIVLGFGYYTTFAFVNRLLYLKVQGLWDFVKQFIKTCFKGLSKGFACCIILLVMYYLIYVTMEEYILVKLPNRLIEHPYFRILLAARTFAAALATFVLHLILHHEIDFFVEE